ncbi:hypothetical protein BDQ94DRAFT_143588 [Aspergillus welwitschiae]|uniref:Uncharacterized protein n=1 Tax=Aspergillus welwitschiae TaxID=1341132 RepID=A0A3F3Q3D7_9EURO|nr:hypothetical protein BDQ94DRAFT_143588 [Aspergillus welwitschiae]RDH33693.1 hypothetical protein BDQ94DRAFT_143588 [Aspergillus welwitschiae]
MIFALFLGCVAALAHFFPSSSSAHHLADIQGNGVEQAHTHTLSSVPTIPILTATLLIYFPYSILHSKVEIILVDIVTI